MREDYISRSPRLDDQMMASFTLTGPYDVVTEQTVNQFAVKRGTLHWKNGDLRYATPRYG